ncbi:hypothetical protein GCM10023116_43270 [Kistimonas scapharcae]|uniref:Uncharacterized protein n=1 Tax=Kistimonas scapharcae TaxID=1036133 RepID=A0ABP8V934_9GAMM
MATVKAEAEYLGFFDWADDMYEQTKALLKGKSNKDLKRTIERMAMRMVMRENELVSAKQRLADLEKQLIMEQRISANMMLRNLELSGLAEAGTYDRFKVKVAA